MRTLYRARMMVRRAYRAVLGKCTMCGADKVEGDHLCVICRAYAEDMASFYGHYYVC